MTRALLIDADSFGIKKLGPEIYSAIEHDGLQVISSQGTDLERELKGADGKFFSILKTAARTHEVCSFSVTKKTQQLERLQSSGGLVSNDCAVLAGALISRANTLVTKDGSLKADFRNCRLIDQRTSCAHRLPLPPNKCRTVITPPHPSSPGRPPKGTPSKKTTELLRKARCSPTSCNCINGGPTC